jgi:hypothetical protein
MTSILNRKQLEEEMLALLDAIINYPYEDEFRKVDVKTLISHLKEYIEVRK